MKMAGAESCRLFSLVLAIVSMILVIASVGGPWSSVSGENIPIDEATRFEGSIQYGLWEFCVNGNMTGQSVDNYSDPPKSGSTVEVQHCMYYTTNAYISVPYFYHCGNNICQTTRYLQVFAAAPMTSSMIATRILAGIATICALFVPCTGYYGHRYEYEESQGVGISCTALLLIVCGTIATGTWSGFSTHDTYFIDVPAKSIDTFAYDWGYNVFISGWALMVAALLFLIIGFKKEQKEEAHKEFEAAMGLTETNV